MVVVGGNIYMLNYPEQHSRGETIWGKSEQRGEMLELGLQRRLRACRKAGEEPPRQSKGAYKDVGPEQQEGRSTERRCCPFGSQRQHTEEEKGGGLQLESSRRVGPPSAWPRHYGWGTDFPRLFVCRLHFSWTESKCFCFCKEHHSFQRKEKKKKTQKSRLLGPRAFPEKYSNGYGPRQGSTRALPLENNKAAGQNLVQDLQEGGNSKNVPWEIFKYKEYVLLDLPQPNPPTWGSQNIACSVKTLCLAGTATYHYRPSTLPNSSSSSSLFGMVLLFLQAQPKDSSLCEPCLAWSPNLCPNTRVGGWLWPQCSYRAVDPPLQRVPSPPCDHSIPSPQAPPPHHTSSLYILCVSDGPKTGGRNSPLWVQLKRECIICSKL